jgi:ferritin
MLKPKIEAALNRQIGHEFTAAYNYLAMAGWFEFKNWTGFAQWMYVQNQEELVHAMKLFKYVTDRGGLVELPALAQPVLPYRDPHEVFAKAFETEKVNSRSINDLYALAIAEKDYMTQSFLKWFLDEQVEEENITDEVEALLKVAGKDAGALVTLNKQLGDRAGKASGGPAGAP